ncbi:hypothetical protein [Actinoplanes subtropicus]|uniref:hypothetical protein n=1 Tax=Actinoplanes subtropicus TaxID=543632 RepID=UPI000B27696B|nr:hypothetical protein [Actinoplanes subtropicus]
MTEDEGWPRGTTGELASVRAAAVSGAALVLILLSAAAVCVALLLVLRAFA